VRCLKRDTINVIQVYDLEAHFWLPN
jgi:hypothetical protein